MIPFLFPCHAFIIPTTHRLCILPNIWVAFLARNPQSGCLANFHLVSTATSSICVSIEFSKVPQVVASSWPLIFLTRCLFPPQVSTTGSISPTPPSLCACLNPEPYTTMFFSSNIYLVNWFINLCMSILLEEDKKLGQINKNDTRVWQHQVAFKKWWRGLHLFSNTTSGLRWNYAIPSFLLHSS